MTIDEFMEHLSKRRDESPTGGETVVTMMDAGSGLLFEPIAVSYDEEDGDVFVTLQERE